MSTQSDNIITSSNVYDRLKHIFYPAFYFVFGTAWIYFLSSYLHVIPNGIAIQINDAIFHLDTSIWINRIENPNWTEISVSHPLRPFIWAELARYLSLTVDTDLGVSAVYGAKLLNALLFGVALVCLTSFSKQLLNDNIKVFLICFFTMMCSTVAVVATPDHFGISFSLLIISVYFAHLDKNLGYLIFLQILMLVLLGGTTITNALFPSLMICYLLYRENATIVNIYRKYRAKINTVAFILVSVAILFVLVSKWDRLASGDSYFVKFFNFRLIDEPLVAIQYSLSAIIYPIVSVAPHIVESRVSLEPINFSNINPFNIFTSLIWLYCLIKGVSLMWQSSTSRLLLLALSAWLFFNIILHNLWGDEFFLFSPHWTISLLVSFIYFAKKTKLTALLLLITPLLLGQLLFFIKVENLLSLLY
ncbi:hypothetical protein [Vibrio sp. HN007]|uniref:hypothetical protein n=1 Tax=Vibrio iocasae TaxID=3098914 RepID=UPI0035D4A146